MILVHYRARVPALCTSRRQFYVQEIGLLQACKMIDVTTWPGCKRAYVDLSFGPSKGGPTHGRTWQLFVYKRRNRVKQIHSFRARHSYHVDTYNAIDAAKRRLAGKTSSVRALAELCVEQRDVCKKPHQDLQLKNASHCGEVSITSS